MTLILLSGNAHSAPASLPASDNQIIADLRPLEVRIRKMHMVRPDLLHYPIQYDVYC